MTELISIENVHKKNKDGALILKGINAKILDGEFITIMGPSGAGKSTLLSLLNRMIEPDQGVIKLKGQKYQELEILTLRKRIGMVFQLPVMVKGSVADNISLGPKLHKETLTIKDIEQLLELVGLPKTMINQDAKTLSGGEKQKLSLARTLANNPDMLLLDEVTSSLDPDSALEIEELIRGINKQSGKTILWVTHNIEQARRLGEYSWVLGEGKLVEQGNTDQIFINPQHEITKKLLQKSSSLWGAKIKWII